MNMTTSSELEINALSGIPAKFLEFSDNRIASAMGSVNKCVDRISDDQLWYRNGDYENSVGNLMLHLAGNVRQFVLHTVAGQPDVRRRDEEFSLTHRVPRQQLLEIFNGTLTEARAVIASVPAADLLTVVDPHTTGWNAITKLEAIYHAVGHLQLHTGQIIFLTKQLKQADLNLTIPRVP